MPTPDSEQHSCRSGVFGASPLSLMVDAYALLNERFAELGGNHPVPYSAI